MLELLRANPKTLSSRPNRELCRVRRCGRSLWAIHGRRDTRSIVDQGLLWTSMSSQSSVHRGPGMVCASRCCRSFVVLDVREYACAHEAPSALGCSEPSWLSQPHAHPGPRLLAPEPASGSGKPKPTHSARQAAVHGKPGALHPISAPSDRTASAE